MSETKTIGKKMLALREQAKMTQEDAVEGTKFNQSTISEIENDRTNPFYVTIEDMADAYGYDIAFIKRESNL